MKTPVSIYIVHHPDCVEAGKLASRLYEWFRLGYLSGDYSAAGLPVYFRRQLSNTTLHPAISLQEASLNIVIILVDYRMVGDEKWRAAIVEFSNHVSNLRKNPNNQTKAIILPGAMHDSFYRTGPLYENFNPIRLLEMDEEKMLAALRRSTTEAIARALHADDFEHPPPLNVFLSHAKKDGTAIAESIRDGIRDFGQLVAWYDANDLPFGTNWKSPMEEAARNNTAALIAAVTDAYPTRPWCRREAKLARTPIRLEKPDDESLVWTIQPVIAVHEPKSNWVRGVPMLEGVPRIGWDKTLSDKQVEQVVDRLVLEILLRNVHLKLAVELDKFFSGAERYEICIITWVPDTWTLSALRLKMGPQASSVRRIIYPGYGLTVAEFAELEPVFTAFHPATKMISFEDILP